MSYDSKQLRGFTDMFAENFAVPQFSFWLNNVYKKPNDIFGLESEYYNKMHEKVNDLINNFSPPYNNVYSEFPLHEVVIHVDEVEIIKGIIGDNYNFLERRIEDKKKLNVNFLDAKEEEKQLQNLKDYLNHAVPNFKDSVGKSFYIPFNIRQQVGDNVGLISLPQDGIFLSHSSQDKEIVRWFRNNFEENGVKVWFDESEILPGDSITAKIARGLRKAEFVALFISENLNLENMSQYVGWELSMAKVKDLEDEQGRLIPIMIGRSSDKAKLPQEVIDKNYADFRDKELSNSDPEFIRLLKKIKK